MAGSWPTSSGCSTLVVADGSSLRFRRCPRPARQAQRPAGAHRLTVEDVYRMVAAGVLDADDRIELVRGVLVDMAPVGPEHEGAVTKDERCSKRTLFEANAVRQGGSNPVRETERRSNQGPIVLDAPARTGKCRRAQINARAAPRNPPAITATPGQPEPDCRCGWSGCAPGGSRASPRPNRSFRRRRRPAGPIVESLDRGLRPSDAC